MVEASDDRESEVTRFLAERLDASRNEMKTTKSQFLAPFKSSEGYQVEAILAP